MIYISFDSDTTWREIEKEFDITKVAFGRKINFINDSFKRKILFRDIAQAYALANSGFNKPAVILAGSILEELLRLYLLANGVTLTKSSFDYYIKYCEEHGLLKSAVHRLTDSIRHFRNLVHIAREDSPRMTISKPTAKGAVTAIFTIANDFSSVLPSHSPRIRPQVAGPAIPQRSCRFPGM